MKAWLRERPWIWIVVLLAAFALADLVLVYVAVKDAPPILTD